MMKTQFRKVQKYLDIVKRSIYCNERKLENVTFCPCDYKVGHTPPPLEKFLPFTVGETFGSGKDTHAWFHFNLEIPEDMELETFVHGAACMAYSVGPISLSLAWLMAARMLFGGNFFSEMSISRIQVFITRRLSSLS